MDTTEFEEIRPYHDEELPQVIEELVKDPITRAVADYLYPDVPYGAVEQKLRSCKTKRDFQLAFSLPLMHTLAGKFTTSLSFDIKELENKNLPYTFLSNHRDIITDSSFLSSLLYDNDMDSVDIAIGDNLLIYPWIKDIVRINRSFIVQRALSMRQFLESSARLSRFMHYTIQEKKHNIWIAQREGRSKDSDDRTQESILKMFTMAGEGDIIDKLKEMNIVPLSLSYEYDPSDFLKAQEFQLKRDDKDYKKSQQDDLINMQTGLFGYKGTVVFTTAPCINDKLDKMDRSLPKAELYTKIAAMIDREIHRNYRIYPGNYVAHDLLNKSNEFAAHYSTEEKEKFETYIAGQLDKIQIPGKDVPFLYEKILLMYANPLKNHLAAISDLQDN